MAKRFEKPNMVPVPSHSIIPDRDVGKSPILECSHLGIDFGGLRAVDDFNLTIGRTEIAGLIGPNGALGTLDDGGAGLRQVEVGGGLGAGEVEE